MVVATCFEVVVPPLVPGQIYRYFCSVYALLCADSPMLGQSRILLDYALAFAMTPSR